MKENKHWRRDILEKPINNQRANPRRKNRILEKQNQKLTS